MWYWWVIIIIIIILITISILAIITILVDSYGTEKSEAIKLFISTIVLIGCLIISIITFTELTQDKAIKDYLDGEYEMVSLVVDGQTEDYHFRKIKIDYD